MIKFEHTQVFNIDGAFRGLRNPLRSWSNSDSCWYSFDCDENIIEPKSANDYYKIGDNDMALATRLIKAGTEHRKFLRQIMVSIDITAPRFWWQEFDTYKIGTTANSESTMHTIHKKEFTLDDFSLESNTWGNSPWLKARFENNVIGDLNFLRESYLKYTKKKELGIAKGYWRALIELLPQSYNQKRTVTMNYEVLLNQYFQRKDHKLECWHLYCDWVKSLPYMEDFINAIESR